MKKVRTIVHLDAAERKALEGISKRDGAPLSELIRRAIAAYLKKEK
jgi:metal-responsive CopG/Arc/MetJ family transcriptional regulator